MRRGRLRGSRSLARAGRIRRPGRLRVGHARLDRLRLRRARVGSRRERGPGDDHGAPPAKRHRRPCSGLDRARRQGRRPERRDDVAPDRHRRASADTPDALRRDHARRATSRLPPAPRERQGRRQARPGGPRDERSTGRVADLAQRRARHRPDRAPRLPQALAADGDRGVLERRRRDVQRLPVSGSSASASHTPSAARGIRSSLATPSTTAATSSGSCARTPSRQRTLSSETIAPYAFDAQSA